MKKSTSENIKGNTAEKLSRLDINSELRKKILPLCRIKKGEIWKDPKGKHKVGVLDATKLEEVKKIFSKKKAQLVINDPPYNVVVGKANSKNLSRIDIKEYIQFSHDWVANVISILDDNSSLHLAWCRSK